MDFINTALVTLKQPSGFWVSILNFFKSGVGSYIVAVILIALLVRIVFSFVDIINKKINMKNTVVNTQMKPELDAIQKKYGHDRNLLQQKTQEVYRKYHFSPMTACLPMLIIIVLQSVVFFTLWSSLQTVSNFNIAEKYENVKNVYANVISLNEDSGLTNILESYSDKQIGVDYKLKIEIENKDDLKYLKYSFESVQNPEDDFTASVLFKENWTNEEIYGLLAKYVIVSETEGQEENTSSPSLYIDNGFNEIIKDLAEKSAEDVYINTQEGFMWIKNIYKAESPTSPLFTKDEISKYLSNYYTKEEKELEEANDYEGKIFDCVVAGINSKSLGKNGYYILTIITVVVSFLSMWLSNRLMRSKNQPNTQPNSKIMYFMMPIIFGLFTITYTSLFAIYIIVGQLVTILFTPFTTWVVKKWVKVDEKKTKQKDVIEVDYRRKDQ